MFDYQRSGPDTFMSDLAADIHDISKSHGFWPVGGRNFGEMVALMHSELSEALEEHRANRPVYWEQHESDCSAGMAPPSGSCTCFSNPKPEGAAVELVDCIIRCLDALDSMDVNVDHVLRKKMEYNHSRPFKHGKKY